MKSRWYDSKETALKLRREGTSMTVIERRLGIPRSTLSGWFRSTPLTAEQQAQLELNRQDGWKKARASAVLAHRRMKQERLETAQRDAQMTLDQLVLSPQVMELALAMLYFGEGAKTNVTSLGNSDPVVLRFFITCLHRLYGIEPSSLRCDLHLRADQNEDEMRQYWSEALHLPLSAFGYVVKDKRTVGRATYGTYKGVCIVYGKNIAIQRKLIMLYTLFCKKVESMDTGA